MKICMVGIGSIGTQHVRNLTHILNEQGIIFKIDALRTQGKLMAEDVEKQITSIYPSFDVLPHDYDIIFLNTPTGLHFEHLKRAIDHTRHIFIEKPVFDHVDYPWYDLPWRENGVYYVACPLRYHVVINALKELIMSKRVFSVRSICSSYLPDWRPGTDYRTCYSAKADQGGGVRIDLIHEWDYLSYLFGIPKNLHHFYGTFSDLEITSEDLAIYIAEYSNMLVSLHIDYFGRAKQRTVELYMADDVLIGDLYNQTIRYVYQDKTVSFPQSRIEMQQKELSEFLAMTRGEAVNHNTVANAIDTLYITLGDLRR